MRILLFAFLLVSTVTFAQDYKWYQSWGSPTNLFDSPSAVCSSYSTATNGDGTTFTPAGPRYLRDDWFYCTERVQQTNGYTNVDVYNGYAAVRVGNSCPEGSVYNIQKGECEGPEPDKCESTVGITVSNETDGGEIGKASAQPPGSICKDSCQYAFKGSAATDVYRFGEAKDGKNMNHAYYRHDYLGNGVSCTQNNPGSTGSVFDQPASKPPMSPDPTKEIQKDCTAWTATGDGTATRTCTDSAVYVNPGKLNCDGTTGTMVCSPGNPSPALNDTKQSETTSTSTGSDGSSTTTTTTTTNTTTCFGVKPCTSTSTTNTKGEGTNADGTTKPTTETCIGAKCGADGDDDGAGDSEEGEEEEPESSVGGEACDATVSCEGDAIQCAILKQQKASTCADELARDYSKAKPEIDAELGKSDYVLKEETVDGAGMYSTGTRFLPSTCPADKTMFIQSFNKSVTFSYSYICSFATSLSYLVVAMASLFFVVYVGRSFGGE